MYFILPGQVTVSPRLDVLTILGGKLRPGGVSKAYLFLKCLSSVRRKKGAFWARNEAHFGSARGRD